MSILYHLGLMQWVILKVSPNTVAWALPETPAPGVHTLPKYLAPMVQTLPQPPSLSQIYC